MGEMAEMVLEGILCELCGVFITENPPGHPQMCRGCGGHTPKKKKVRR